MWHRRSKYGNKKVEIDGITFDSIKEGAYYQDLKLLKRAGKIHDFQLQPEFELQPSFKTNAGKTERAIKYVADFIVFHDGYTEIVDVKGFATESWKIKWKMMKFRYQDKGYKFTIV